MKAEPAPYWFSALTFFMVAVTTWAVRVGFDKDRARLLLLEARISIEETITKPVSHWFKP